MRECRNCGHLKSEHGTVSGPNSIGQSFYDMRCTHDAKTYHIGGESDTILACKCPGFKKTKMVGKTKGDS